MPVLFPLLRFLYSCLLFTISMSASMSSPQNSFLLAPNKESSNSLYHINVFYFPFRIYFHLKLSYFFHLSLHNIFEGEDVAILYVNDHPPLPRTMYKTKICWRTVNIPKSYQMNRKANLIHLGSNFPPPNSHIRVLGSLIDISRKSTLAFSVYLCGSQTPRGSPMILIFWYSDLCVVPSHIVSEMVYVTNRISQK